MRAERAGVEQRRRRGAEPALLVDVVEIDYAPDALLGVVRPGDVVIALGAGDVNASVRELKTRLEQKGGPP